LFLSLQGITLHSQAISFFCNYAGVPKQVLLPPLVTRGTASLPPKLTLTFFEPRSASTPNSFLTFCRVCVHLNCCIAHADAPESDPPGQDQRQHPWLPLVSLLQGLTKRHAREDLGFTRAVPSDLRGFGGLSGKLQDSTMHCVDMAVHFIACSQGARTKTVPVLLVVKLNCKAC
jgi:hypothetical protein